MGYNKYLFFLLMMITCSLFYIAYLAWKKREFPVAVSLFFGMCAGAFYSFGYGFEIISSNLEQIRFWLQVEYIGISFGTYFWFIMVLHYTGYKAFLQKRNYLFLAIIPIITFVSHYTNPWHHLFYSKMTLNDSAGFPLASLTPGPFYILHACYAYLLFIIGMVLLVRMYRKASLHMKKQVILMMIGSCGPYGITLLYLSKILNTPIDFSPLGFLFSGIFFIWGIYQFNMMKLIPHALKKVFESMKDPVIVLDLDDCITSFNQAAKFIFQDLHDKRMVGRSAIPLFAPYQELAETLAKGGTSHQKVKIDTEKGPDYYQVYVSEIRNKRRNVIGKMVMFNDITESVITEERLLGNSRQLGELNAFKDKMFTVVAHDIRDPLSILVSLMEILKDEMRASQDGQDEIMNEMEKQIHNTFTLVESLLDWFRSQKGGMLFNPVEWNLSEVVQRNIGLLYTKSDRKRIKIITDIPNDTMIYADKEMLDLIIRNLLSNAIKFTDYDGKIQLKADHVDNKVRVSIRDTGKGIDADQARELFRDQEVYHTSLKGTAGERGVGVGLTLCKEFVHLNGGEIWFESVPDQGTTFYFTIPGPKSRLATLSSAMKGGA